MRRLILLTLMIISSSSSDQIDEFYSKKVYLKSRESFVKLSSIDWIVNNNNETIVAAVRLQTNQYNGNILRLKAVKDKTIFELNLSLRDGILDISLIDDLNESIVTHPFTTYNMKMSSSNEHSIGIRIKPNELIYSIEKDKEMVATISRELDIIDSKLEAILGSEDGSSIRGCITLVSITLNSPLSDIETIAEYDTDTCSHANNECSSRDCNQGVCKELETATCDCFGTGKSGPNCRSDSPSIQLLSSMDETIKYLPLDGNDQEIKRISTTFSLNKDLDEEGVIISGKLLSHNILTLYVVKGKGSLQIGPDVSSQDFDLNIENDVHTITLFLHQQSIILQVDNKPNISIPVKCQQDRCLDLSEIRFGSDTIEDDDAKRIGINGCLWDVYVDEKNILSMYYMKDPRISSPHTFNRCNGDKEENEIEEPNKLTMKKVDNNENKINKGSILQPHKHDHHEVLHPCSSSIGNKCKNGGTCLVHYDQSIKCHCLFGYYGDTCQFSSIPRSCAEAYDFYHIPNGPTLIDIDGSGPMTKSVVDCNNGTTTVTNDMPPHTTVHDTIEQHSQFIISYRDLTHQKLGRLIMESEICRQEVEYECVGSSLGFDKQKTQLTTIGRNRTLYQLGRIDKKCNGESCKCIGESIGSDKGTFESPDVGVTKILSFRDNKIKNQNGQMTVGPILCSGHSGSLTPIRFTSPAGILIDKELNKQLSIQFRTSSTYGIILTTLNGLEISIRSQYTIGVSMKNGLEVMVESPHIINDTNWHLIQFEIESKQIRLSFDNTVTVDSLDNDIIEFGQIQLGDPVNGFIGCLRSLRLHNLVLDLHKEVQHIENNEIHLSCPTKCTEYLCKNEALCIDNLMDESASPTCMCKLPEIQEGENCEIDINKSTPLSFHGGHLKYEDLLGSLTGQIVLSFRTDQQQGLILFTHDEKNNFLQLHLSSETSVTLTLNNMEEVFECTVYANPGNEYSNMEWVQVIISHLEHTSTLSINGELCFIHRRRELSGESITTYAHVETEIVKIPIGLQHHSSTINPFTFTFLGGVNEISNKNGTVTLVARYDTNILPFLGCIRGFRVGGNNIDLTHTTKGTRPSDPDLIQIGCDKGCSSLQCFNGGHCSILWTDYSPSNKGMKTHCNCERTSYIGNQCQQDHSISLINGRSVSVDIRSYLERYPLIDKNHFQTLKFAFMSNKQATLKQTLATLYFKDQSIFEVVLNRNGSIHIGSIRPDKTDVLTFPSNYSNGHRHFIVIQFKNDTATDILIDSTRLDLPYKSINLDLFDVDSLVLGSSSDQRFTDAERENFDGCLSNVEIDFEVYGVKIRPITELIDPSSTRWISSKLHPEGITIDEARIDSCGQFEIINSLPGLPPKVHFPVWDTNFARLEYNGIWIEGGEEESSFPWWIILIIIIILSIIAIVVYCICCKSSPSSKKVIEEEEMKPLRPIPPISSPIPSKPKNNFEIPEPDSTLEVPIDKTDKSDAYFTAREFVSSDDDEWDRTITQDHIDRPNHLESASSFNRSMPHRLSSFKSSDPTVPKGSPLYGGNSTSNEYNSIRRSPKPVPPPRINALPSSNQ